jgi:hypothetical protein
MSYHGSSSSPCPEPISRPCLTFRYKLFLFFRSGVVSHPPPQPTSWRTAPCRLSATAYSIYSQLSSMSDVRSNDSIYIYIYIWFRRRNTVSFTEALGICLFTTASRTALGPTQPPIYWLPGALSLGVKRPARETDHSPLSTADCMELCLHSPNTPSWRGAELYINELSVSIHSCVP